MSIMMVAGAGSIQIEINANISNKQETRGSVATVRKVADNIYDVWRIV
jgi:hypothetical protein